MGRSSETFGKKEVRTRKEKKRKEKEEKRSRKKGEEKKNSLEDMIAYVDEFGVITSTPPDPDKRQEVDAGSIELEVGKNREDNISDNNGEGVVNFYNEAKGYGFIRDLDSDERIFFHASDLLEPVKENTRVVYEKEKTPKGLSARKVSISR